jgi:hypothetical protein
LFELLFQSQLFFFGNLWFFRLCVLAFTLWIAAAILVASTTDYAILLDFRALVAGILVGGSLVTAFGIVAAISSASSTATTTASPSTSATTASSSTATSSTNSATATPLLRGCFRHCLACGVERIN